MKKKLTKSSFDVLRTQFLVLSKEQQRTVIGGGYFDNYGIGYYDDHGNYYWVRTKEDDGNTSFSGDFWDSSSSSGQDTGALFRYDPNSGYGTSANPVSIDDYNAVVKKGFWNGGYVEKFGYIDVYASSVEYGNSIYFGGSWYAYGSDANPVTEDVFYKLVDDGKWHGGCVQGWGYVSKETVILGSTNSHSFNVSKAVNYLTENANSSSTGYCARAVRSALEAGGLSTSGRPNSAGDYDSYLPTLGFSIVTTSSGTYVPQAGDIIVHEATSGHSYGHIAMYNGKEWISDFRQNDMYGGSAYRQSNNYTILRWDR